MNHLSFVKTLCYSGAIPFYILAVISFLYTNFFIFDLFSIYSLVILSFLFGSSWLMTIFFEKEKFSGIIDFYFSCNDFFAFEIAICFNALCFDGVKENLSFNVTKAKNFIEGYSSIRKLTEAEKDSIKVLSQGAALRFLLTRVFDALNTVEGAIVKVKDPIEYLKRLEFHKNSKNHEDYFF